jgi:hypothetical protein
MKKYITIVIQIFSSYYVHFDDSSPYLSCKSNKITSEMGMTAGRNYIITDIKIQQIMWSINFMTV